MADELNRNEEQPWRVQALREECARLTREHREMAAELGEWRKLAVKARDDRDRWMLQAGSERENALDLQEQLRLVREGYELAIAALREEIDSLAAGRHGVQRDAATARDDAHETAPGGFPCEECGCPGLHLLRDYGEE